MKKSARNKVGPFRFTFRHGIVAGKQAAKVTHMA